MSVPSVDNKCLYEISNGIRCSQDRASGDAEYCVAHRILSNILKEHATDAESGRGNWS